MTAAPSRQEMLRADTVGVPRHEKLHCISCVKLATTEQEDIGLAVELRGSFAKALLQGLD
jgi:hypothetical protein